MENLVGAGNRGAEDVVLRIMDSKGLSFGCTKEIEDAVVGRWFGGTLFGGDVDAISMS